MIVRKCDKCNKVILDKPVIISLGYWPKVELCKVCARPVLKFLGQKSLLQKEMQEIGFKEVKT